MLKWCGHFLKITWLTVLISIFLKILDFMNGVNQRILLFEYLMGIEATAFAQFHFALLCFAKVPGSEWSWERKVHNSTENHRAYLSAYLNFMTPDTFVTPVFIRRSRMGLSFLSCNISIRVSGRHFGEKLLFIRYVNKQFYYRIFKSIIGFGLTNWEKHEPPIIEGTNTGTPTGLPWYNFAHSYSKTVTSVLKKSRTLCWKVQS